jgi:hypothetical protein
MATTTTNFGWDIPQSTDLVKDGATAIAALGQDIDTAFIDLKGGTTGQVLAKASNTDLDYSWVAQDDSNAIQNAIVDAKGDLIGATAADTPARLAVGTNGQVLTADSTAATGLKWAAAASGSTFAGCVLTNTANISLSNGTTTTLTWDTELQDTDAFHSTATNTSRITIPAGKAGTYLVTGKVEYSSNTSGRRIMKFLKNGGSSWDFESADPGSTELHIMGVAIFNLAVGDYLEMTAWQNSGTTMSAQNGGTVYSTFAAYLIGA